MGGFEMQGTSFPVPPRALLAAVILLAAVALPVPARAHDAPKFAAGEPGNPKKPYRTITVKMDDRYFEPSTIVVRRGEQIRFVLSNDGFEDHEFMLATAEENRKHAEVMKKFPDMEHDDPNGKRLSPFNKGALIWKFTKRGVFEFACLIPGHFEAGMVGKVIVK